MKNVDKTDENPSSENARFVIVGAGLVGCLASVFLSKLGFNVTVYEFRDDVRKSVQPRGKSINLALSHRGLEALKNADIPFAEFSHLLVPMKGRMIHKRHAKCEALMYDVKYHQFYQLMMKYLETSRKNTLYTTEPVILSTQSKLHIYSIGRNDLNKMLLNEAEKRKVVFNFRCKVIKVDFCRRILNISRLLGEDQAEEVVENYDYLIGCDGAYSVIRHHMLRTPLFNYSQTYIDHGYIELSIPQNRKNEMATDYLHIWPRLTFMMIALPNENASWTVTLFMPFEQFARIKNRRDLLEFFGENFADALPLIGAENLVETYFNSKPQPLVSIKCDSYTVGNDCLIIGDAAHAVVPFFGQGMNAGFEDCQVLYEVFKRQSLTNVFEEFSRKRVIDTHAVSNLSMYNYLEMRNLIVSKRFLLFKKLDNILYRYLWRDTWKPLYVHVTFSSTPYSRCLYIQQFQRRIFKIFAYVAIVLFSLITLRMMWI